MGHLAPVHRDREDKAKKRPRLGAFRAVFGLKPAYFRAKWAFFSQITSPHIRPYWKDKLFICNCLSSAKREIIVK